MPIFHESKNIDADNLIELSTENTASGCNVTASNLEKSTVEKSTVENQHLQEPKNSVAANDDDTEHEDDQYIRYPTGRLAAMTRKRNEVIKLMTNRTQDNMNLILELQPQFIKKISTFRSACQEELSKREVSDEEKSDFSKWIEQHSNTNVMFLEEISTWIQEVINGIIPEGSNEAPTTTLKTTSTSTSTKGLESSQPQDKDTASTVAKIKPDLDSNVKNKNLEFLKTWEEESMTGGDTESSALASMMCKQNELSVQLLKNQTRSMLPVSTPETFDGSDILGFESFLMSFDRLVVDRTSDYSDRYYYLLQYTKGEAHDLVQSCNCTDAQVAYDDARATLSKNYGNDFNIANIYMEKLNNWKSIPSENPAAMHEFAMFLTKGLNMMKHKRSLSQLNSLKEIKDVTKKLPFDLRRKFRDEAGRHLEKGNDVTFELLVNFVNKQAKLLKIPLLGELKESNPRQANEKSINKKSFYAGASNLNSGKTNKSICPCCKKPHSLDICFFFLKKSIKEREEFIRNKKLCFGCLSSTEHPSRYCKQRITCKICSKKHPTSLHKEMNTESNNANNNQLRSSTSSTQEPTESTNAEAAHHVSVANNRRIVYPAVLVNVQFQGGRKSIRTYMGLDPFSSATFVDSNLLKIAGVRGEPSKLSLTTMNKSVSTIKCTIVRDLLVTSMDGRTTTLSKCYSKDDWPFTLDDSPRQSDILPYNELKDLPFNFDDCAIGILVGMNRPDLIKPEVIVSTSENGLYASRHYLGWALNGPTNNSCNLKNMSFHVKVNQDENYLTENEKFEKIFAKDFVEDDVSFGMSLDDEKFISKVQNSITQLPNGHFQICLPFKNDNVKLPNNISQAHNRLVSLKKKFVKDVEYFKEYKTFIDQMIEANYAERIPSSEIPTASGQVWYLTHFSVRHKQKNKLRVVFDCSLRFANVSLNDQLLQGPDMTNTLLGVLLRFRQYEYAFSGDIQSMFYQIRISPTDTNFLRFLWFPDGNLEAEPVQYRLMVHVFGARSSPSCSNYALKHVAEISTSASETAKNCIRKSFYVDDLMISLPTINEAQELIVEVDQLLKQNGFNLTEYCSNSRQILDVVPHDKLSKKFKTIDFNNDELPYERALGTVWNTERDTLACRIQLPDRPCTKRGVLSTLFSIYDPLFLIGPALVSAKKLFQECCALNLKWDEALPENLKTKWMCWLDDIENLKQYELPRCICKSAKPKSIQLHIFSDGSMISYGAVAYLRVEYVDCSVSSTIVMATMRLTPLNRSSLKTVPRIELNAAKLAVCLYTKLLSELELHIEFTFFWCDSICVLNYIKSEKTRFQRFVSNRVAFIRSQTKVNQWYFVPGEQNPADIISRGTKNSNEFINCKLWQHGPEFLVLDKSEWPQNVHRETLSSDDPEIKSLETVCTAIEGKSAVSTLLESTSSWYKLRLRVAYFLRLKDGLHIHEWKTGSTTVMELRRAEIAVWKYLQQIEFGDEYSTLVKGRPLPRKNFLNKLSPFIDKFGLMRAKGRLCHANINEDAKYPIILKSNYHPVELLVRSIHSEAGHLGREFILSRLSSRYYIVGASKLIKKLLRDCLICRKQNSKPSQQIMADLPPERLIEGSPPFTHSGTDFFGPMYVSKGRGKIKEKRYGVLFTCLSTRAIHIELTCSLDTDAFLNSFRRFTARRGIVKMLRSDNATNYTSSNKELQNSIAEWNKDQISDWCKQHDIEWRYIPPSAPHYGGVWEREVRSIKKVLESLLSETSNKVKITDEILSTLLCEVEDILNHRPLTPVTTDIDDEEPLTPNHLLKLQTSIKLPPGKFEEHDLHHRKRWRIVQHLADVFWRRWRKQYIPQLIARQKWTSLQPSHEIGDLVLVVDQLLPRNMWCLGKIESVNCSRDGLVRSAQVRVSRYSSSNKFHIGSKVLQRPISKLILLKSVQDY